MSAITLGMEIRRARMAKGMTQDDLGNQLHVTKQAISKWEQGINYPDRGVLPELIRILDIDKQRLFSSETGKAGKGMFSVNTIGINYFYNTLYPVEEADFLEVALVVNEFDGAYVCGGEYSEGVNHWDSENKEFAEELSSCFGDEDEKTRRRADIGIVARDAGRIIRKVVVKETRDAEGNIYEELRDNSLVTEFVLALTQLEELLLRQ